MKDTIMDVLTATRDLMQYEHGPNAPATIALNQAIEDRRLEVATIRVTLAEAQFALNECREKYGCDTPVSATEAITGLLELQNRYRAIVH